jgi:hypothetical protein
MIDLQSEKLISLADAAKLVPPGRRGKRTHLSTVLRWVLRGARGPSSERVKLEAVRLGGRWLTSAEALQRFAERLTPRLDGEVRPIRSVGARERANIRAERELARIGI